MKGIDRRSALKVSALSAAALPVLLKSGPALAQKYGPDEGKEIAPGVRIIQSTTKPSHIPAYKTISMRDIVFQPGAKGGRPEMSNDMVCHMLEGELFIDNGPDDLFNAPTGQVWSCTKGQQEFATNKSDTVAIMRVIDLLET